MAEDWNDFWPLPRLGEALEALATRAGFNTEALPRVPPPPRLGLERHALAHWFDRVGPSLGTEVIQVEARNGDLPGLLTGTTPALFQITPKGQATRFLAVLRARRGHVDVLCPDGDVRSRTLATVLGWLRQAAEREPGQGVDALLADLDVPEARRAGARKKVLAQWLKERLVGGCWVLRLPASAPFRHQLRQSRLWGQLGLFVAGNVALYGVWALTWYLAGRGELGERLDRGAFQAWVLLLLSLVPLLALAGWTQGRFALGFGALFKQRLLWGALRMPSEDIRRRGSGELFGLALESDTLETFGLSGGFLALAALFELSAAVALLATGAGGLSQVLAFVAWLGLTAALVAVHARRRVAWNAARIAMTHDMVEKVVGHRTRLLQEAPERLHDEEDPALARYLALCARMDRTEALLLTLVPRGWTLAGLCALVPAYLSGSASTTGLALALGGVLLASRAFAWLGAGAAQLIDAGIALKQAAPLWRAGATAWGPGDASVPVPGPESLPPGTPLMEGRRLHYTHEGRHTEVLQGVDLEIRAGDRILLEGSSGAGKSTLVSLLSGLRQPTSGLLLSAGMDVGTLGELGWGRQVAAILQTHENHVFTESFAFNLLVGRAWPPQAGDLEDARVLCEELGLGPLLERMPGGLSQLVGEQGWQLSHGERSRLFIARALLQGAHLVILDESLAALDPDSLERTLRCVNRHARAQLLIAHGTLVDGASGANG